MTTSNAKSVTSVFVLSTAKFPLDIDESQRSALLRERQELLDKKFSGELTYAESTRLAWVRWQLDRLEDELYRRSFRPQ